MFEEFNEKYIAFNKTLTFSRYEGGLGKESKFYELEKSLYDDFYKDKEAEGIYWCRENIEKDIIKLIVGEDNNKLISIEGIKGCGKSTLIRKLLEVDLREKKTDNIILNFRLIYDEIDLITSNKKTWKKKIYNIIRNKLLTFFENYEEIYEFALFKEKEDNRFENNINWEERFLDERRQLEELYKYEKKVDKSEKSIKNDDLKKWYGDNIYKIDQIKKIRQDIFQKLEYSHILHIIKDSEILSNKIIIFFDNVDEIEDFSIQSTCFGIAKNIRTILPNFLKVIIAIRPETAHVHSDFCDDETIVTRRNIAGYNKKEKCKYLTPEDFHNILLRRYSYFFKKYNFTDGSKEFINRLIDNLRDVRFFNFNLIDIANQSIRDALDYQSRYIRYLLKLINDESYKGNYGFKLTYATLQEQLRMQSFFHSTLLGWIVDESGVAENPCPHIVDNIIKSKEIDYWDTKCDIYYLILVNLLKKNATEKNRPVNLISVLKDFASIGYDLDDIKENIWMLYKGSRRNFAYIINLYSDKKIENISNLDENIEISLNFRGECLIKYIVISFTFINKMLYNEKKFSIFKDILTDYYDGYYYFGNYYIHAKNQLIFLSEVAFTHTFELLNMLKKISKRKLFLDERPWLKNYKRRFSVYNTENSKYKLELERIIDGNIAFIKKLCAFLPLLEQDLSDLIEKYKLLEKVYVKQTNTIGKNTLRIYDYKKIIDYVLDKNVTEFDKHKNEKKFKINVLKYRRK